MDKRLYGLINILLFGMILTMLTTPTVSATIELTPKPGKILVNTLPKNIEFHLHIHSSYNICYVKVSADNKNVLEWGMPPIMAIYYGSPDFDRHFTVKFTSTGEHVLKVIYYTLGAWWHPPKEYHYQIITTTPPHLTKPSNLITTKILYPSNNIKFYARDKITLTILAKTSDDSKTDHVEFYVDGKLVKNVTKKQLYPDLKDPSNYPYYADVTLTHGTHTIEVIAYDIHGNYARDSVKIEVSRPTTSGVYVTPVFKYEYIKGSSAKITFKVSTVNELGYIAPIIDGKSMNYKTCKESGCSLQFNLNIKPGVHTVKFSLFNPFLRRTVNSNEIPVIILNKQTKPDTTIITLSLTPTNKNTIITPDQKYVIGNSIKCGYSVKDYFKVENVRIYFDGKLITSKNNENMTISGDFTIKNLHVGKHTIKITAENSFGISKTLTREIVVDGTRIPSLKIIYNKKPLIADQSGKAKFSFEIEVNNAIRGNILKINLDKKKVIAQAELTKPTLTKQFKITLPAGKHTISSIILWRGVGISKDSINVNVYGNSMYVPMNISIGNTIPHLITPHALVIIKNEKHKTLTVIGLINGTKKLEKTCNNFVCFYEIPLNLPEKPNAKKTYTLTTIVTSNGKSCVLSKKITIQRAYSFPKNERLKLVYTIQKGYLPLKNAILTYDGKKYTPYNLPPEANSNKNALINLTYIITIGNSSYAVLKVCNDVGCDVKTVRILTHQAINPPEVYFEAPDKVYATIPYELYDNPPAKGNVPLWIATYDPDGDLHEIIVYKDSKEIYHKRCNGSYEIIQIHPIVGAGDHVFTVRVIDNAGHVATSSKLVKVIAPKIQIIPNTGVLNTCTKNATVKINVSNLDPDLKYTITVFRVDSWSCVKRKDVSNVNNTSLTARFSVGSNNIELWVFVSVQGYPRPFEECYAFAKADYKIIHNCHAPIVKILSPPNGSTYPVRAGHLLWVGGGKYVNIPVMVSVIDPDHNLNYVEWVDYSDRFLDQDLSKLVYNSTKHVWEPKYSVGLKAGTYTIHIKAVDKTGLVTIANTTFTIKEINHPPIITISPIGDDYTLSTGSKFTITATATDVDGNLKGLKLTVKALNFKFSNGSTILRYKTGYDGFYYDKLKFSFTFYSNYEGTYKLQVDAFACDHESVCKDSNTEYTLEYTNAHVSPPPAPTPTPTPTPTPPSISVTITNKANLTKACFPNTGTIKINYTVTTTGKNNKIDSIEVYVDNQWMNGKYYVYKTNETDSYNLDLSELSIGNHTITVTATDTKGDNASDSVNIVICSVKTPPPTTTATPVPCNVYIQPIPTSPTSSSETYYKFYYRDSRGVYYYIGSYSEWQNKFYFETPKKSYKQPPKGITQNTIGRYIPSKNELVILRKPWCQKSSSPVETDGKIKVTFACK